MIGSFWNLCRACPSMPVDKLHSEYRSTYRWHEYTGGSRPEVIRRPPIANQFAGTCNEPPLPRRKKCPELAYKTHEFINCDQSTSAVSSRNDSSTITRARSESRGTPSRRSKSEGPHRMPNGQVYPIGDCVDADRQKTNSGQAGESSGLLKKTISKLSTEYRRQFVWPHSRKSIKSIEDDAVDLPRKSFSMGAIKAGRTNAMPGVHKKRNAHENEATVQELEPLVNDGDDKQIEKKEQQQIRKIQRPMSHYSGNRQKLGLTDKENFGFASDQIDSNTASKPLENGGYDPNSMAWYRDVIELRKKAGEYKNRGWGVEMKPDVFNKQKELWDQVSRRSSLSALSLASTVHRPISKEEKEKENNKKSSPTKPYGKVPGQVHFIDNKITDGRLHNVRHHLGRTTGPDAEEGALLPSPTREKLMPTIPKSKDDESYSSQRGSPKKSTASKHGSPQKGSPQKSPKKITKQTTKGRSQSVGPVTANTTTTSDGSPKRQARSGSAVPTITGTASAPLTAKSNQKKPPSFTPTIVERRPRPTTLSTSNNHSRSKSSSLPPNGRSHSAHYNQIIQTNKLSPSTLSIPNLQKSYKSTKHQRPKSAIINGPNDPMTESTIKFDRPEKSKKSDRKTAENDEDTDKEGGNSISSASPLPAHEVIEHIVKSPPEPTRVKSPEQVIMRSPDPVNWTVPLDTGKTFTVTQNVRDGDPLIRPQSEFKASTPVDKPPTAPMSAPPELAEPAKLEAWNNEKEHDMSDSESLAPSKSTVIPNIRYDKPVPGSTLRCLDDPTFDTDINNTNISAGNNSRSLASDVLEKARDRFDRFWGGQKEENV